MARHDWTASSPGLIRSLRPDGEGLVSWRICDWHRFSLADVAPLGRDPALLSDLNLWRSLQSSACPLLEQQSVPTPPAERFILLLDQEAGPARDMLSMLETVLSQHPGLPVWVLPDEGARRAGLLARTLARSPTPMCMFSYRARPHGRGCRRHQACALIRLSADSRHSWPVPRSQLGGNLGMQAGG